MPENVRLPKLSASMREGTIVSWLKREGETVQKGEPLFQLETDKAVMEVEAPASGVLARIVQGQGKKVAVDTVVAVIA
jgi:pyruvate dehydrogenase E2 component (dihydrolipoamide acetyltransferase)